MHAQTEYAAAVARNTRAEIANFFRENPGCTMDDAVAVGEWSKEELIAHGPGAAREAGRASIRRVA